MIHQASTHVIAIYITKKIGTGCLSDVDEHADSPIYYANKPKWMPQWNILVINNDLFISMHCLFIQCRKHKWRYMWWFFEKFLHRNTHVDLHWIMLTHTMQKEAGRGSCFVCWYFNFYLYQADSHKQANLANNLCILLKRLSKQVNQP